MGRPLLSVIIPAYNELENFKAGKLDQVDQFLDAENFDWEVIVVDDGSKDGTVEAIRSWVASKPHWKLIANPHHGKAKTVETGMSAARGMYRLFTDFDQATPIEEVRKVLAAFKKGADVVIGSREIKGASRHKEPIIRHVMGRVFNALVQFLALRGISDSQCGFKAFTAEATEDLFGRLVVYKNHSSQDAYTGAFDVELLFLARKKPLKIVEIPVAWNYVDTSRVNPLKDSIRMLTDIVRIRLAYLQGRYR